jgi:ABC-type dipeptide/oligopeptide/nickel transport system permease component
MSLLLSILFGGVGGIYLAYARRQHDPTFLTCGVLLLIYPYFFDSALLIILIGVVIAVYPIAQLKGWF